MILSSHSKHFNYLSGVQLIDYWLTSLLNSKHELAEHILEIYIQISE